MFFIPSITNATLSQVMPGNVGAAESLTINNTAGGVGFTSTYTRDGYIYAERAIVGPIEGGQIRYTLDGSTAPTTTVGSLLEIGDVLIIEGASNIQNFKAIRTGSTSGTAFVEYER